MTYRTFGSLIVLISILTLPYWFYLPILFIAVIIFPFFWEGILFALLVETIYGKGTEIASLALSPLPLSVFLALIILLPLRESLRIYV